MSVQKFPKSIGACIDQLYGMRKERLALQTTVDAMKADEKVLEDHILEVFGKDEITGAKGSMATGAIKQTVVVNIDNWDEALAFVKKKKAWHLLTKRLSSDGVKELWDAKLEVPGVSSFTRIAVSTTKAGG